MTDLKFALRQLFKNPGFTAVVVLTLALGVGANTAIFSVVNAVLLRPPPFEAAERLVFVSERSKDLDHMSVAYPNFRDWRQQQQVFTELAAFRGEHWNLTGGGVPERIAGLQASASFFGALGVQPILGRAFTSEEDRIGGERVVVVSEGLWRRRFGADPAILHRTLALDGQPHTIVGVMPASFSFPRRVEVWTPIGYQSTWIAERGWHPGIYVVGRLKPGVTVAAARSALESIAARLAEAYPDSNTGNSVTVMRLQERLAGSDVRAALYTLLGAVGLVLLIACTNITNLLLARASQRRREIAVRLALGAQRGRLLRQLLTESLLLGALGGVGGLLVAGWGLAGLRRLVPPPLLEMVTLNIDLTVLLFTVGVALATSLVFGLAPAWQLAARPSVDALKEGGRSDTAGPHGWGRRLLIVSEVALALMLLVGAGLLLRSFERLQAVPVGLDPSHVLTMELSLPNHRYPEAAQQWAFYRRAAEAIERLPGVRSAGFINPLPLGLGGWQTTIRIEGEPPAKPGQERLTDCAVVTPDYFQTMGVAVLKGRAFTDSDDGRVRVCLIDETFEHKHFAGDALGKRLARGREGTNWMTIVGVVGHVKNYGAGEESRIETYEPVAQNGGDGMTLVIKADGDPTRLTEPVRKALREVDAEQPVAEVLTMDAVLARSVSERRLATVLLSLFAGLALALAAVGIYGLMAVNVAHRTREIGIRMALGAPRREVMSLVLRQGGLLVGAGLAAGWVGALALSRLLTSLLFQVRPTDPTTFALTPVLLAGVALLACLIPARRATRVDPMEALRTD